jgi:N-acetyl-anhydromuramyl-L-alanine amidase AmpD
MVVVHRLYNIVLVLGLLLFTPIEATPMRYIDLIVIHATDSKPSMNIGVKEIREWHLDRDWKDIGYHFVIRRDGTLEVGRQLETIGSHVLGHNDNSIGIALVGGMSEEGLDEVNFTMEQYITLDMLITDLRMRFTSARVTGHYEFSTKTCPMFNVQAFLDYQ